MRLLHVVAAPLAACLCTAVCYGQAKITLSPAQNLIQTVSALDKSLFDAYNHCDVAAMGNLVAEDLEFFHDEGGLAVGRKLFLENTQKYICGKVQRDLVPGTLEVFPIKDYGAMEVGVHRFRHPGHDDSEPLGEARFLMIWRKTNDTWQLTRVVSYGHGAAK